MQKTEYSYREGVRIGIICLIFALCMGKHAYGSIVVDEVLIGGQEEHAPVDAAPAAQASVESGISQSISKPQAEPVISQSASEPDTEETDQSKATKTPQPDMKAPQAEKSTMPARPVDVEQTDTGHPKVPTANKDSVSTNDKQQFHIPRQKKQTDRDKVVKSGKTSEKNSREEKVKHEIKTQEQSSIWQDTAETAGKAESEVKTRSLLLPGFIMLCIGLLLAGSICLIRDNNIDLKK